MAGAIVLTAPGRNELQNMVIADVDFKKLPDGVYTGAYWVFISELQDYYLDTYIPT